MGDVIDSYINVDIAVSNPLQEQILIGGAPTVTGTPITRYYCLYGGASAYSSEPNMREIIPTNGKIENLRIRLSTAPTGSYYLTLTLLVDGSPSAPLMECTVSGNETWATSDVSVPVTAGQRVTLRSISSLSASNAVTYSTNFVPNTPNYNILIGCGATPSDNTNTYYTTVPVTAAMSRAVGANTTIAPINGTLRDMYLSLSPSPGTGTYTIDLMVGGVAMPGYTLTFTGTETYKYVTGVSCLVAAGQRMYLRVTPTNLPVLATVVNFGIIFETQTAGNSQLLYNYAGDIAARTSGWNSYYSAIVWGTGSATENYISRPMRPCHIDKLYASKNRSYANATVGFRFELMKNFVTTGIYIDLIGTTQENSISCNIPVILDDVIDMKITPLGDVEPWTYGDNYFTSSISAIYP